MFDHHTIAEMEEAYLVSFRKSSINARPKAAWSPRHERRQPKKPTLRSSIHLREKKKTF